MKVQDGARGAVIEGVKRHDIRPHHRARSHRHCVAHVTEELKALPDVVNISVTLAKGGTSKVLVYTNADISDAALKEAIDEAGEYNVESIVR